MFFKYIEIKGITKKIKKKISAYSPFSSLFMQIASSFHIFMIYKMKGKRPIIQWYSVSKCYLNIFTLQV